MDDIRAVLDAVGSERAVLFGLGDASPLSVLFAATYPERTAGLILMNASPRFVKSPGLPWLPTRERRNDRPTRPSVAGGNPPLPTRSSAWATRARLMRSSKALPAPRTACERLEQVGDLGFLASAVPVLVDALILQGRDEQALQLTERWRPSASRCQRTWTRVWDGAGCERDCWRAAAR